MLRRRGTSLLHDTGRAQKHTETHTDAPLVVRGYSGSRVQGDSVTPRKEIKLEKPRDRISADILSYIIRETGDFIFRLNKKKETEQHKKHTSLCLK